MQGSRTLGLCTGIGSRSTLTVSITIELILLYIPVPYEYQLSRWTGCMNLRDRHELQSRRPASRLLLGSSQVEDRPSKTLSPQL